MVYNQNRFTNNSKFFFQIYQIFFLINIIKSQANECEKQKPFFKSNECTNLCTKEEYDSKFCILTNHIIKSQNLTNIIYIGDFKFRYVNFASYSNGDMVFETTSNSELNKRIFYGLKQNGRPLFKDKNNGDEIPFYSKKTNNEAKFESESLVIKHSLNGKEYYLSISKEDCYTELFDFENDEYFSKTTSLFVSFLNVESLRHSFFPLSTKNTGNNYYYMFCFVGSYNNPFDPGTFLFFQKHIFKEGEFSKETTFVTGTHESNGFGKGISCFQSESEFIICLYLTKIDETIYINFMKYEQDLQNSKNYNFSLTYTDEEIFLKCLHLKGDVGLFAYYLDLDYQGILYPVFDFKIFNKDTNEFEPDLSFFNGFVTIKKYQFNTNLLLNDIIKLSEKKIIYSATSQDKESIYIISINFFGDMPMKIKMRYYEIKSYLLYNYKILFELRIHKYNNFIAFASSFCPDVECSLDEHEHYSALMIFSYPNSTDDKLYLDQFLFNNNNITINNIEIDLKNKFKIENNIFGYILSNIKIKKVSECEAYKLYSSKNEINEIVDNYTLEKDENIKIKSRNNNIYPRLNCKIEYHFNVIEPELFIYDLYPSELEGDSEYGGYFEIGQYEGRLTYFYIILNQEFTSECENIYCDLCRKESNNINSYCITCKSNYNITKVNGEENKFCFLGSKTDTIASNEPKNDVITYNEPQTDIITYNEPKTDIITYNEPKTDIITYNKPKTDIIPYDEPKTNTIAYNLPKTNIITNNGPKTDIITYNELKTNIITYDESKTNIINYDESKTDIITYDETKSDIISYDEPKTNIITYDETKTDIITYDEPKTDIIIYDESKSDIITYDEPKTDIITYDETKTHIIIYDETKTDKLTYDESQTDIISYDESKTDMITNDKLKTDIINNDETKTGIINYDELKTYIITNPEPKTDIIAYNENKTAIITNDKILVDSELSSGKIIEKTDIKDESKKDKDICKNDEIVNNKCQDKTLNEEQIEDLYKDIKNSYIKKNTTVNNTIIKTQNVIYQISKIEEQEMYDNLDVSNIDLGACKDKLIKYYSIPKDESLIIYKVDIKSQDLTQTFVQYEVYDPISLISLNLSICNDVKITISSPVVLDNLTSSLYDSLKKSGYDLFNKDDSFYTDICSTYTTENGTDIILADRNKIIYNNNGNISPCQKGCELLNYNSTTRKAKCNCLPQESGTKFDLIYSWNKFDKYIITDSFLSTLKNSNFLVLKCYKLAIALTNILSNKGRILMTIIISLSLILLIVFCFCDFKRITYYIKSIYDLKIINNNSKKNDKSNIKINKIHQTKKNNSKIQTKAFIRKNKKSFSTNKKIVNKNIKAKDNQKKTKKTLSAINKMNQKIKNKKEPPKKKLNNSMNSHTSLNSFKNNEFNPSSIILLKDKMKKKKKKKEGGVNIINIKNFQIKNVEKNINFSKNIADEKNEKKNTFKTILKRRINKDSTKSIKSNYKISKYNTKFNKKIENKDNIREINNDYTYKNLNDQELNTLEYEIAIILDKRTYCQYYCSLLKKKHLILFTFYPNNDYNLVTLKICLFLLSFSLYFTINGFFFSDDTMHKIYEDKGAYNILFQIPQILYSSVVSSFINMILKKLSLSENNIISIKQEKNIRKLLEYSQKIKNCLIIKFIIFFILKYLFLLFFWYFISCFCAVYTNTQIILINDSLISFCLSMVYPIGLYLLPGFFRISALRAKGKNKQFIYKISKIIALI